MFGCLKKQKSSNIAISNIGRESQVKRRFLISSIVYYKGGVIDKEVFASVVDLVSNKFGMTFDEFSYCYMAPPKTPRSSCRFIGKNGKFSKLRLRRFYESMTDLAAENGSISFGFTKYIDGWYWKSIDIEYIIWFDPDPGPNPNSGLFTVELSDKSVESISLTKLVHEIIGLLKNNGLNCYYGITVRMADFELPSAYLQGGFTEWTTPEQKMLIRVLNDNKEHLDERLWDISWGNIINRKHFVDEHTVEYLIKVLGKDNVIMLGDDVVWFNLKEDVRKFDKERSKTRIKLLKYFDSKLALPKEEHNN